MKINILAALFLAVSFCFIPISDSLNVHNTISQNKSPKKEKIKTKNQKKTSKAGTCSLKKCKVV